MHIKRKYYAAFCCASLACVIIYASLVYANDVSTIVVYEDEGIEVFHDPRVSVKTVPTNMFQNNNLPKSINSSCGIAPKLGEIKFNNVHWQTLQSGNATFQLLGAYLDVRIGNKKRPTVRFLAMVNRVEIKMDTYCQLWFKNKVVLTKQTWSYYMWKKAWGVKEKLYQPHLISCQVPKEYENNPPIAVSLVAQPCDRATNILKVVYNKPEKKKDVAVCVKGLAFVDDYSERLVEWIELLHLLGASKIYLYELHVHNNMKKVLDFYEKMGIIEVTPLTLPGDMPNHPKLQHEYLGKNRLAKRLNELMPYNDCFYKHMYEYNFIALLDTDEVIVPKEGTWVDLLKKVTANNIKSSYNVRNVYFIDDFMHDHDWFQDVPKNMHMLQHVYRTRNFTKPGYYVKSFHNTEKVLTLHNHYPTYCVETCRSYGIDTGDAQLQHYRTDCVNDLKSCKDLKKDVVMDTTIWNYKQPLIERVQRTLKTLGFVK